MSLENIRELVNIPSPTGYTDQVVAHLVSRLSELPYVLKKTRKGSLMCMTCPEPRLMVMAHIDTLGGMVKQIKEDGTLEISQLGGYPPNSFEGEYVTVISPSGKKWRGTFLVDDPAAHVNNDVSATKRSMENMRIRLDEIVSSRKDVEALGLSNGDFVAFDPRFEITESGFLKSRFIDDKACSGFMLDILLNHYDEIKDSSVGFYFSNYEEVGHACPAGIPESVEDVLIADMGVVGHGVDGEETKVSICAKDSAGPYDYALRTRLTELAIKGNVEYIVDVFPYYSSDGTALWRSGRDVRIALIGPGVSASHGVERTHKKGIDASRDLVLLLIKDYKGDE